MTLKDCILEFVRCRRGMRASIFAGDVISNVSNVLPKVQGWNCTVARLTFWVTRCGLQRKSFPQYWAECLRKMKYESGVHRVQRVPAQSLQGRVHTPRPSVLCFPEMDWSRGQYRHERWWEKIRNCFLGPGGQSVNTNLFLPCDWLTNPSGLVGKPAKRWTNLRSKTLKRHWSTKIQTQQSRLARSIMIAVGAPAKIHGGKWRSFG